MLKPSKHITDLKAYAPGLSLEDIKNKYNLKNFCKLASNENLAGCSPKVKKALIKAASSVHFYPDPECKQLKQAFAKFYKINKNYLSFSNGSNEAIDLLIRIYANPLKQEKILTFKGAFIAYKICAQAARIKVKELALDKNLNFNVQEVKKAINKDSKIKIVFIPNPNNPTGNYLNKDNLLSLVQFCEKKNILIVIDEAYKEFVKAKDFPNTLSWLKKYKCLAVIRTLSKAYALAGLRLGVLIADPKIIFYFNKVRNPFNVNSLVQIAAQAAIADKKYLKQICINNKKALDIFYTAFDKIGIKYIKSQTNFILFDCQQDGNIFCKHLLTKGLVLRSLFAYGLKNYVRMTIGTPSQNQKALLQLKIALQ